MTEQDTPPAPDLVGGRVRARRIAAGLTVAELARRVGVSSPFVSQVEAGRSSLSISSLYRFASVLGCSPNSLLGSEEGPLHVLRAGEGTTLHASSGEHPQKPRLLTDAGSGVLLEAYHYVITAAQDPQAWFEHPGEDFVYVFAGEVAVQFADGRETVLGQGDSLHHGGAVPHRWVLHGEGPAEVLLTVVAPPA